MGVCSTKSPEVENVLPDATHVHLKKKKKKREKVFMSQPSLESQLNPRLESFIRMDGAGRRRGERRESSRKESAEREKGERESLVISISIPSTACAVRQPVCPNKQPAEGGRLIITSPLFSHPEFTFHLTTNTRPGLWPCPLTPLEFRDVSGPSKATVHMLFGT